MLCYVDLPRGGLLLDLTRHRAPYWTRQRLPRFHFFIGPTCYNVVAPTLRFYKLRLRFKLYILQLHFCYIIIISLVLEFNFFSTYLFHVDSKTISFCENWFLNYGFHKNISTSLHI